MTGDELRLRTRQFALAIIKLYTSLPKRGEAEVLGRQLLRSGTSVGAHYREACRARSRAEFVSKIEGGLQELEETCYWLELLQESRTADATLYGAIAAEAEELIRILVASVRTAKRAERAP